MIDRREAVRRISVLVGGALCPSTVAGLMAGCRAPAVGERYEPRTLSRTQLRRVETVAELIIPATDTPGASGARVHEYVDMMLTDFFGDAERGRFLSELEQLDEFATSLVGKGFDDASPAEQTLVLAALDDEAFPDPAADPERAAAVRGRVAAGEPPFMRTMKELTVTGYYTSEVGQTVELRIPPFGPYLADEPLDRIGRSWA